MPKPRVRLFEGYTAWFSKSCNQKYEKMWLKAGGELELVDAADFVISENIYEDDTLAILQNKKYIKQHLKVFSPFFIDEVLLKESISNIRMGKYILPFTKLELNTQTNNPCVEILEHQVTAHCSKDCEPPLATGKADKKHSMKENESRRNTESREGITSSTRMQTTRKSGNPDTSLPYLTQTNKTKNNAQTSEEMSSPTKVKTIRYSSSPVSKPQTSVTPDNLKEPRVTVVDLRNLKERLPIEELHDCFPSLNGIRFVKKFE